jgi:hypothetical protein
MGGSGSGFQGTRKATVEDGLTLSLSALMAKGALVTGQITAGTWNWSYPGSPPHASIGYVGDMRVPDAATLRLHYKVNGEPLDYVVRLVWTPPRLGGRRWWFLCPLDRSNDRSPRRVSKLHLPPGARYFGSRTAYGLTYQSCRDSNSHAGLYGILAERMNTDPAHIRRALKPRRAT